MPKNHALRRAVAPNVFEAFRQTVLLNDVPRLAALLGMMPGTLYNKASAGDDTHHQPTLRDVVQVTQATGDMRTLDALNEMFGRASFDCAAHEQVSDDALLELVMKLGAETGEFHAALGAGLREQRFSAHSLLKIRAEGFDIVSALMTLLKRLEGYVDDEA